MAQATTKSNIKNTVSKGDKRQEGMSKTWTKKDFKVNWFSGTGAGGQHRNKHQNCVRITHIESGITVTGQNFRERKRNLDDAFHRLAYKICDWYWGSKEKERNPATEPVRTLNLAENRVTDHRTGEKMTVKDFEKRGWTVGSG